MRPSASLVVVVLSYTISHRIMSHRIALHRTAQFPIAAYHTIPYRIASHRRTGSAKTVNNSQLLQLPAFLTSTLLQLRPFKLLFLLLLLLRLLRLLQLLPTLTSVSNCCSSYASSSLKSWVFFLP